MDLTTTTKKLNKKDLAKLMEKANDEDKAKNSSASDDEAFKSLVNAQQEILSKMDFMADADFDPYEEVETDEFGNCIGVMVYGPSPPPPESIEEPPLMHPARDHHAFAGLPQPHHYQTMKMGSDHPSLNNCGDDEYILDDMSLHSSDLEMDHSDFPEDDFHHFVGEEGTGHRSCPSFPTTANNRSFSAFDDYRRHPSRPTIPRNFHESLPRQYQAGPHHFGHSSWAPDHWNRANHPREWNAMRDRAATEDSFNSTTSSPFGRERVNTDDGSIVAPFLRGTPQKQRFYSSFSSQTQDTTIASGASFEGDGSNWSNNSTSTRRSAGTTKDICKSVQFLSIALNEEAEKSETMEDVQKKSDNPSVAAV